MHKFKATHSIGGRKITKFVTRSQILETTNLQELAETFVAKARLDIQRVGPANTYNSDQSGFNFELHSGRTLHTKGVKKVNAVVQRVNSTTHSYTVQPILNAEGEFTQPMLLILPEPSGSFGPVVKQRLFQVSIYVSLNCLKIFSLFRNVFASIIVFIQHTRSLFQAPNLKIVATKSGKCTSQILKDWYEEIFRPQVVAESVILLDAFGGFNKATDGPSTSAESIDDEGTTVCP